MLRAFCFLVTSFVVMWVLRSCTCNSNTKRPQKELTTGPQTLIVGDGAVNKIKTLFQQKHQSTLFYQQHGVRYLREDSGNHCWVSDSEISRHTHRSTWYSQATITGIERDFNLILLNKVRGVYQWTSTDSSAKRREIQQADDAKQMAQRYVCRSISEFYWQFQHFGNADSSLR